MVAKLKLATISSAECGAGKDGKVLSVDIASAKALAIATVVNRRNILSLHDASERFVSDSISAISNVPPFDNSAMDGYAVSMQSFPGSGPWELMVSERIFAGDSTKHNFAVGEAARIMTGAPMPMEADTVIMQEHCIVQENSILVQERPLRGRHVRLAGEDVSKGRILVSSGTQLNAGKLALLAAAGINRVKAYDKVRIGIISTGSELTEPGQLLAPGKIYNSNRYYLRSRLNQSWIDILDYGIVSDDKNAIQKLVQQAAEECDILFTTGGVSAGEKDHMIDVLAKENAELEVLKVAIRPGKPVTVGKLGKTLYFGLPGNPYAAAVTFEKIAWPAIWATAGSIGNPKKPIQAVSGFNLKRRPGRTEYVPVTWSETDQFGRPIVQQLGRGSSASLLPLAEAGGLATLRAEHSVVSEGDVLEVDCIAI